MKESIILRNIQEKLGITELNEMQKAMLGKAGKSNIMLLSPTGTGKTIAYLIYLLKNIKESTGRVQAVILSPSRELTIQISGVVSAIATEHKVTCCYGGHNFEDEANSLKATPDIIVSTPGRLLDHIKRDNIYLQPVRMLFLDEFDKSLELGFQDEMGKIIKRMPNISKQVLTSATLLDEFPSFINIRDIESVNFLYNNTVEQRLCVYNVKSDLKDKLEALLCLISNLKEGKMIIFANHRESAMRIHSFLQKHKLPVGMYHGGLNQMEREKAIYMFANDTFQILVTTDLGSRGLDIDNIKHIIHYHIPLQKETYTHRNGRSARIDKTGSIYVITGPEEKIPEFVKFDEEFPLDKEAECPYRKTMKTLYFSGGKKEKISKKDILGFIVSKTGIDAKFVGKINVADHYSLVAVPFNQVHSILQKLAGQKIKNQKLKIAITK